MKRLTCEMCGSTDLIKEEGLFVCQGCGCKYSIEEAKKLMVEVGDEGSVPAVGTEKNPVSQKLENLYTLARRARDDDNSENAAKYYSEIVVEDPNSWEANFYHIYYTAMSCKIGQIASAANAVCNCLGSVFGLIKDHVETEVEQKVAYLEVMVRTQLICTMLYNAAWNTCQGSSYSGASDDMAKRGEAALNTLYVLGERLVSDFNERTFAATVYGAAAELAKKHYTTSKYVSVFNMKKSEFEMQVQQEKNEAYWAEHAEEKAQLEAEQEQLQVEKEQKNAELTERLQKKNSVPALGDLSSVQSEISALQRQKDSLGMFKGKEKKAIQEQIDAKKEKEREIKNVVAVQQGEVEKEECMPIRQRIREIDQRIREIEDEFEKDR